MTAALDLLHGLERRAIVVTLREHPQWRLEDLLTAMESDSRHAATLRSVTIAELLSEDTTLIPRLAIAKRAMGAEFDDIVHRVLVEAGRPVRAGYLRARVGGPRWKLQDSLSRLVEAGRATQQGRTSNRKHQATRRR